MFDGMRSNTHFYDGAGQPPGRGSRGHRGRQNSEYDRLRPERLRVRHEHAGRRHPENRQRHLLEDGDEPVRLRALCAALQAGQVQRHLQRRLLHPRGRPGAEPRRRAHRRRRERQRQVDAQRPTRRATSGGRWRTSPSRRRPPRASRGSPSPRRPPCGACTSRASCICSTSTRRGTRAGPAAASWPTRSWTARSSPPRSSSGSPATANGPIGATASGTWSSWAASTPRKATFPNPPYTVVDKTPVIREKPYLYVDGSGEYRVFVPALQDQHPGRQLARRPDARRSRFPSTASTSPSRQRRRPRASTPRWPRASTSCSRPAFIRSTTPFGSPRPIPSSSVSACPRWSRRRACRSSRWPTWTA